jgi:LytS/YehU family sensor histidine kinase
MYFQKKALNKKFEQDKKVTELELLTIKNQIDPHFIINAINSLGAVIFKSNEEKKQSYQYLVNITSLIRDTLQNSQKVSISLSKEIEFVQNYLQLQKYRYRDSFDFKINNQVKDPEEAEIPKMIIQTFAENAVKHGLANKTDGTGKIVVYVSKENGTLKIVVEDNGIGRKKASKVSKGSTGKGMEIIDQIIEMYNRLKKTNVSFKVIDLYDDDGPAGTRVVVSMPER